MHKCLHNNGFRKVVGAVFGLVWLFGTAHAEVQPESSGSFTPANGFKPAQRDLTQVFLHLAGSLESYGTPEPYLRHVLAEGDRVESLYRAKYGRDARPFRPAYLSEAYVDRLAKNWNHLAPNLELDPLARRIGSFVVQVLADTGETGTALRKILKEHERQILNEMFEPTEKPVGFSTLRTEVLQQLLPASGGNAIGNGPALEIQSMIEKRNAALDAGLKKEDAEKVKAVFADFFLTVGEMAEAEFRTGIAESALQPPTKYDPAQEKLTARERHVFLSLLAKERFTKADFETLDSFYKTAYDKLSNAGKDQLSKRIWNGSRR